MKHILLNIDPASAHGRDVLSGIAAYVQQHNDWNLNLFMGSGSLVDYLDRHQADGAIGLIYSEEMIQTLQSRQIPIVNTSAHQEPVEVPSVLSDNHKIGDLAARYLMRHGFRYFLYLGSSKMYFSRLRHEAFSHRLEKNELPCQYLEYGDPEHYEAAAIQAIYEHPNRVAVFAATDLFARRFLSRMRHYDLYSPTDYAILGVDNCSIQSELSPVPISSIDPDFRKLGYESAQMLDHLLKGHEPEIQGPIPPRGVVQKSTTLLTDTDPILSSALEYIQHHACRRMSIDQMAESIGYSRRTIERRFRSILHCKVLDYIKTIQFEEAREQLRSSTLPIHHIAKMIGYADHRHFSRDFKKHVGMPPSEYRRSRSTPGAIHPLSD